VTRDPFRDAQEAGLSVEIADLGDWSPATLVSEYDHERRAIRVNVRELERARADRGGAARERLLRHAVAHELYHRGVATRALAAPPDRPSGERAAETFVLTVYGAAPAGDH
jgi:hypothetical protein